MATPTLFDTGIFSVIGLKSELLIGTKLYWFVAGTSTPAVSYADPDLTVPNPNPMIADATGRFREMWLGTGPLKYVLVGPNGDLGSPLVTVDYFTPTGVQIDDAIAALLADIAQPTGSSLIGFLQAGTGAVARTAQAKMRERISVMDFGAVGDGVTDDTTAVIRAATRVNALGGGTVYFPPPPVSYALSPVALTSLNRVSFDGGGSKIIALQPANTPQGVFTFTTCNYFEFHNFDIDGRYPTWAAGPVTSTFNNHNIFLNDCTFVDIHDNYLHDSGVNSGTIDKAGDSVYITGSNSRNINIHDNISKDWGRWFVAATRAQANISIANNVCEALSTAPSLGVVDIEMNASNPKVYNVSVTDNTCIGRTIINFSGSNGFGNVTIAGNNLNGQDTSGVQKTGIYTYGIALENTVGGTVSGNTVQNWASAQGLALSGTSLVMVGSNSFIADTCTTLPPVGGYASNSNNCVIADNIFRVSNATGFGFQTANTIAALQIKNNVISNPLNFGLGGPCGTSVIDGNELTGAANASCNITGTGFSFVNNRSSQNGRLSTGASYVANNNMTIGTTGGNWWEGGGVYVNPDLSKGRTSIWLTAAPTAGTWKVGDMVWNVAPAVGQPKGWQCTVAGTPGTWVSMGNL